MTDDGTVPRKRLRVGYVSERGGINAVRTLLESQGLVVDEVDGRADYGRDLNVDITTESRVTGGIVGVQVKGGASFGRGDQWRIPATPSDWAYWRNSTLPVIGMTWDPGTDTIRWVNLTQRARARVLTKEGSFAFDLQDDQISSVATDQILNEETFSSFLRSVGDYLRATGSSAFLELVSEDDEIRCRGVYSCWTLGRADPAPLVLLRRLLPSLTSLSLHDGITVLAHATPHPDIGWNPNNWIFEPVQNEVRAVTRWSASELVSLVHGVEQLDPDIPGWERGGVGQSLWSIMAMDPEITHALRTAIRLAADEHKLEAAVRLLVCYQWVADDPLGAVLAALSDAPTLNGHELVNMMVDELRGAGRIDVY